MKKIDYKKEYPEIYLPKKKPSLIEVPPITYLMVDGTGNPNTSEKYKQAIEILYGLSFTIKMSKMKNNQPLGYFEYVVPPLEGLWWIDNEYFDGSNILDKNKFNWTSMIRQPEFVTPEVFEWAKQELSKKKPDLDLSKSYLKTLDEGLCAQIMHIGSYDNEKESISILNNYIKDNNYQTDINDKRKHHEIYLSDPRKSKVENLKTVIRHPIKKIM